MVVLFQWPWAYVQFYGSMTQLAVSDSLLFNAPLVPNILLEFLIEMMHFQYFYLCTEQHVNISFCHDTTN